MTHEGRVHAWALPSRAGDRSTEGGAVPDTYAEYDVAPRVAGDTSPPLVHVASADGGATLWIVAAGAASGKVAVARCDGVAGSREEMGEARLPRRENTGVAPRVTALAAMPSARGGSIAVVGCDRGELFLVECVARGTVTVTAMRRDGASGGGTPGGASTPGGGSSNAASTPSKWGAAAMSSAKAALRFLTDPLAVDATDTDEDAVRSLAWAGPAPGRGDATRLIALTGRRLEEWEVERDGGGGHALVVSNRALGAVTRALRTEGDVELISAAPAPGAGVGAVVVLAAEGRRWSLHRAELRAGGGSLAVLASAVPAAGAVPSGGGARGGATVLAGGAPTDAALVVTPGGGAALFAHETLSEQMLMHDPAAGGGRVMSAAAAPSVGGWLMLTELMGVVAYSPATADAAATPTEVEREMETEAPPPLAAVDVPIPPIDVDPAEAEAAVRAEFAAYASGGGGVPSEAGFRLRAAGALTSSLDAAASPEVVSAAPFASNSRAIVDALPKHWPGPSGPGPAVEMHLDEKARRHDMFLQWLVEAAGVYNLLSAAERERILEHGEMVAALLCVRQIHNEAAEADDFEGGGGEEVGKPLELLREAAVAAGEALQSSDAALKGRPAAEVCYSRATGCATALLPALADGIDAHGGADSRGSLHERATALDTLSRALLGALNAAADYRRSHAPLYPPSVSSGSTAAPPRWNAGEGARRALRAAAVAAVLLRDEAARGGAPDLAAPLGSRLLAVATPLLDACAADVAAAEPGSDARAAARAEYISARNTVLPALMDAAREGGGGSGGFHGAVRPGFGVTMDAVAAVAEAHFGYEQLAEVCEAALAEAADATAVASATARLHHHMRTLRGAPVDGEGTFATFMFERSMSHPGCSGSVGRRIAETLQNTPDEFYDELTDCLRPRPPLLWLHQLRADDYVGAASTLRGLSGTGAKGISGKGATLAERRQFLSLAKLSLLASGASSEADEIVSIDAALNLTEIQSGLLARRSGGKGDDSATPLPPLRLVESCLGEGNGGAAGSEPEDVLDAFSVFASAGGAFREANKTLLEACWRRAAAETDWEQLSELRASAGDVKYVRSLVNTPVARAARRCYQKSFAVRLGPPFDEVLTPRDVLNLLEGAVGGGDRSDAALDPIREAIGLYALVEGDDEDVVPRDSYDMDV